MEFRYLSDLWDKCLQDATEEPPDVFLLHYKRVVRAATGMDLVSPRGKGLTEEARRDLIAATVARVTEIKHLPSRPQTPFPRRSPPPFW